MDALSALALQIEWGADEALDDLPVDRTHMAPALIPPPKATLAAASAAAPAAAPTAAPRFMPPLPGAASRAAAIARAAPDRVALRAALAGFTDCPLAATATSLVFADGNPDSGLVLVGEAPGAEEDVSGRPFAGPDGALLDRMLGSIGLDRRQALLTCLIPWRPPGNRPVTEAEVAMCLPFLRRHLALLRPRVVVTLGQLPARALLGSQDGIRRLRGRWHETSIEGCHDKIMLLPMLHPRTLLATPLAKREAWADMIKLRKHLDGH